MCHICEKFPTVWENGWTSTCDGCELNMCNDCSVDIEGGYICVVCSGSDFRSNPKFEEYRYKNDNEWIILPSFWKHEQLGDYRVENYGVSQFASHEEWAHYSRLGDTNRSEYVLEHLIEREYCQGLLAERRA